MVYGKGWYRSESDSSGNSFRWMDTRAELAINRDPDKPVTVSFNALSLLQPRRLTVSSGSEILADVETTPKSLTNVTLELPQGQQKTVLTFRATPRAQVASNIEPTDRRKLAIAVYDIDVTSKSDEASNAPARSAG